MNIFQRFKKNTVLGRKEGRKEGRKAYNALTKKPLALVSCLFFLLAAFAFTGCTWGGEHTFDLKIDVPTDKMFGPRSKAPLDYDSKVTVVAYLAGDYAHHTREVFENVPAGTRSLPIMLGGVPLGRSTLVIEAIADTRPFMASGGWETGYYGEKNITVTGGVNTVTVDMDYGVIVRCNDSYSQKITGEGGDGINAVDIPNIGARPLAEGDFLILRQGKRPLEQRNFTSRLRNNLTTAENYLFDGYIVSGQGYTLPRWLYSDHFSAYSWHCEANDASSWYYQFYGSPYWTLYSGWKIRNGYSADDNIIINGTECEKTSEIGIADQTVTITGSSENYSYYNSAGVGTPTSYKGAFIENRKVELSAFKMGQYEVTQELYTAVMGNNPSGFKDSPHENESQKLRPVEQVTWYQAVAFCNKLTEILGIKDAATDKIDYAYYTGSSYGTPYTSGDSIYYKQGSKGYRLPTEAEWEFAARGGDASKAEWKYAFAGINSENNSMSSGTVNDNNLRNYGWYSGLWNGAPLTASQSGQKTHAVGEKKPNTRELYDMSGNVWEWCWDWHNDTVTSGDSPDGSGVVTNPVGASSGFFRVKRGGSWSDYAGDCAVSYRSSNHPGTYGDSMGFRVVRSQ